MGNQFPRGLTYSSYRSGVDLKFVSHELAFDDISECVDFVEDIDKTLVQNPNLRLDCKRALDYFEERKNIVRRVDIKGQI